MKKILFSIALFVVLTASHVYADTATPFTVTMGPGSTQTAQVINLQQFLIAQGFLHVAATGNYLSLTTQAVENFQTSQGITPTGYFGPLTLAAANKKLTTVVSSVTTQPAATVAVQSTKGNSSEVALAVFSTTPAVRTITWQTVAYPTNVGVDIHLIRQISQSPASYTLVRQLATNTPNTGSFVWTPQVGETANSNLYVEVTCTIAHQFTQGCQVSQIISAF
jgi:peptidoglycan hydrolase-like protein with peptidoglycan-binding domain